MLCQRIFQGRYLKLEKYFFNFFPFPNAGPKPTHHSRSNSIYRILLQIFLAIIFVFDIPLKLRVVHVGKNYKISLFSKMAPTIQSNFVGLLFIRTPTIWHYGRFPEKSLQLQIYFQILYSLLNVAPIQLTNLVQILYLGPSINYLQPVLFTFDLPLKLRVAHIRIKLKISIFSKMAPTKLIKFVGLQYIRNPTI